MVLGKRLMEPTINIEGGVYFVACEKETDSQNCKGIGGRDLMERMGHMFST